MMGSRLQLFISLNSVSLILFLTYNTNFWDLFHYWLTEFSSQKPISTTHLCFYVKMSMAKLLNPLATSLEFSVVIFQVECVLPRSRPTGTQPCGLLSFPHAIMSWSRVERVLISMFSIPAIRFCTRSLISGGRAWPKREGEFRRISAAFRRHFCGILEAE